MATSLASDSWKERSQSGEIENLSSSFQRLGRTWNLEKNSQFKLDQANSIFIIIQCLNAENESSFYEYPKVKKIWRYLRGNYSKTNKTIVNSYISKFQSFKYHDEKRIDRSWEMLKELRRKLVSAELDLKKTYPK